METQATDYNQTDTKSSADLNGQTKKAKNLIPKILKIK